MEKKPTYNFGEKKEEYYAKLKKNLPVVYTSKYVTAKTKAIEILDSKKYDLEESDFWILMNATKNEKMAYTGLIISHNGCIKINNKLDEDKKYKPGCITLDKDGYGESLVYTYNCPEQGIYEVGEVNKANCTNDYPYAMALKRLIDRVVLKLSGIAQYGIYSDSESEEFNNKNEATIEETKKTITRKTTTAAKKDVVMIQPNQIELIKQLYEAKELLPYMKKINKKKIEELTLVEASELIKNKSKESK